MFAVNDPGDRRLRANLPAVTDDRITVWARALAASEVRAFMRARRRFLKRPSGTCLHAVRIAARRLRSLLDDFADAVPNRRHKRLRALIDLTGVARDARVLRQTLRDALDAREREGGCEMLRFLRQRERHAIKRVRHALWRVKFE